MTLRAVRRPLLLLLLSTVAAVLATIVDAVVGHRTGSWALAWGVLAVAVLAAGIRVHETAGRMLAATSV